MPSPVGHALAGLATGWLLLPAAPLVPGRTARLLLVCAGLAVAPDLDLVMTTHRGASHSVAAAVVVAAAAWLVLRNRTPQAARIALACGAAYGSHVLLDWLGVDTSPPLGVAAWWPFSTAYYQAPRPVFLAVSRRFHQPALFWLPNALALMRELLILGPLVAVSWYVHRRRAAIRKP
jgi:inner membrane protein